MVYGVRADARGGRVEQMRVGVGWISVTLGASNVEQDGEVGGWSGCLKAT